MARHVKIDLDKWDEAIEAEIQSRIDSGELVVNGPRGNDEDEVDDAEEDEDLDEDDEVDEDDLEDDDLDEDEDEAEDEDDVEDFLDLPQYNEARFGGDSKLSLPDHPLVAKLQGRKAKQPVYNSDDDDDDFLDLPQYDPAAFGKW